MPKISVVTPCYNEEGNVRELYARVRDVFSKLAGYSYEHLFIDNASTDGTMAILRVIAREDKNVKVILNARNFGHIRSPHHALLQASGDAAIPIVCDLQEPPDLIPELVRKWGEGYKIVLGEKVASEESSWMFFLRNCFYDFIGRISEIQLVKNCTGFGLYDRNVLEVIRRIGDPYPYIRGMICEIGFDVAKVPYRQPRRWRGITKNNFYTLYDIAMLGITNHSKVPLRIATMLGFSMSALWFLVAVGYLVAKLMFWDRFPMGTAPMLIGLFAFSSVQLFFIGILGEYIGGIHTQVLNRPLVVEKERINF